MGWLNPSYATNSIPRRFSSTAVCSSGRVTHRIISVAPAEPSLLRVGSTTSPPFTAASSSSNSRGDGVWMPAPAKSTPAVRRDRPLPVAVLAARRATKGLLKVHLDPFQFNNVIKLMVHRHTRMLAISEDGLWQITPGDIPTIS